jgi:hypothetical protein
MSAFATIQETNQPYRSLLLGRPHDAVQGERPVGEQHKKESDRQQSSHQRQEADQDKDQHKSDTQRQAEEAARRDHPKGGASSVGTVGT